MLDVSGLDSSKLSRKGGHQGTGAEAQVKSLLAVLIGLLGARVASLLQAACLTAAVGYVCFIQNALQEAAGSALQSF